MTNRKSRRRWFQFSLRSLLMFAVVVGFACGWFAMKVQVAHNERKVAAPFQELRGRVEFNRSWHSFRVTPSIRTVSFFDSRLNDADLKRLKRHLERQSNLEGLVLSKTAVTDVGLEHLKGLAPLEKLGLWNCTVTDAGLEHVKGLTNLKVLVLTETGITDVGLEHLKELRNLQRLHLEGTQVTDQGLKHLERLTDLRELYADYTRVTDEGVKKLQQALPNCEIVRER